MTRRLIDAQLLRSKPFLALLLLAIVVVGCSGPEDGESSPTGTTNVVPTITATTSAPALPTDTVTAAATEASSTATLEPVTPTLSPTIESVETTCATGVDLVGYSDELNKVEVEGETIGGLSALAWTGDGDTYYALSDRGGWVYVLDFPLAGDPEVASVLRLQDSSGEPDNSIDGEGLVILPNGDLLVSSEAEPSIRQYTSDGEFVAELPVPDMFLVEPDGQAIGNRTFESLALSPSGEHLFTAVEQPLLTDGSTDDGLRRIRIQQYDLIDGAFQPAAAYFYLAEADQGVSEITAIDDDEILVLERGLSLFSGFSARVFRVSLGDARDVSKIEGLADSDAQPATKNLLIDIADCPAGDEAVIDGINPLLENFESMTFGPQLSDGRRSLFIGSDDNFQSFQVTRYLTLAVDPGQF